MLKRTEDPTSARSHRETWHLCVDKLFDISKNDIKDHLCEDFKFIQNQKGPRQATFGGTDMKLRQTNQKTSMQRRVYLKTSKSLRL